VILRELVVIVTRFKLSVNYGAVTRAELAGKLSLTAREIDRLEDVVQRQEQSSGILLPFPLNWRAYGGWYAQQRSKTDTVWSSFSYLGYQNARRRLLHSGKAAAL
jgi:hypothetical protein